jgi:alanyl-tRNA synthetase
MSKSQKGWKEAKTGLQIYNEIEDGYNGGKDVAEQDWNECFEWVPVSVADARLAEKDKEIQKLKQENALRMEELKDEKNTKIEALQLAILSIYKPETEKCKKELDGLKQKLRELEGMYCLSEIATGEVCDQYASEKMCSEEHHKGCDFGIIRLEIRRLLGVKEGDKP